MRDCSARSADRGHVSQLALAEEFAPSHPYHGEGLFIRRFDGRRGPTDYKKYGLMR